MFVCEMLLAEQ